MYKWGIAILLAIFCLIQPVGVQAAQADEETTYEKTTTKEDIAEDIAESKGISKQELTELMEEDPEYYRVQQSQEEAQEESTQASIKTLSRNNIFDSKTYQHNSRFANYTITQGIDISYWNTITSWSKIKSAGVDFALIRVGYRGYGSGGLYPDRDYKENLKGAQNAGIKVGAYIFSQATTVKEAKEEAEYLLDRISGYKISGPVILDYEYADTGVGRLYNAHLSRTQATNVCLAFCEAVKKAGYTPMVYANKTMLRDDLYASQISEEAEIWLAHYTTKTDYQGDYDYWQCTASGSISGISGRVDCNFHYQKKSNSKVSVSKCQVKAISDRTYTGKAIKPSVTIQYNRSTLTKNKDYTVTYKNNIELGKATVTITGMGNYTGTVKKTFKIVPAKVTGFKKSSTTKTSITLKWTKSKDITGYQVTYSAKNGKSAVKKTITSQSKTSCKITGLTKGYEYLCSISAYKSIDGVKHYSTPVTLRVATKGSQSKIMTKESAGLRAAPAGSNAIQVKISAKTVLTPICVTKSKAGNTWYKVSYKKNNKTYTGYIISTTTTKKFKGKVKSKGLNLRKSASSSGKQITSMKKGKKVTIQKSVYNNKTGVTWVYVSIKKNGKTYKGYCNSKYISV